MMFVSGETLINGRRQKFRDDILISFGFSSCRMTADAMNAEHVESARA